MKPIRLVMEGFGPYAEREEIDFARFGEEGIYLVTGDTGAGKTTIFDGICFALFGRASGSYREAKSLRSDFASPDRDTRVTFSFSHRGRTYTVERSPEYTRQKKRGTGVTKAAATATLEREGEKPVSGTAAVDAAIRELLRLNYDQFKQIAMIAQGEFQRMLNADTKERAAILQKVFLTGGYKRMAEILRQRMEAARAGVEESAWSISQRLSGIECRPGSGHEGELSALKEKYAAGEAVLSVEEMLDVLARIRQEDEGFDAAFRKEIRAAEQEAEAMTKAIALAKDTNGKLARLEELKRQREHLERRREDIQGKERQLDAMTRATRQVKPAFDEWKKAEAERAIREKRRALQEAALKKAEGEAETAIRAAEDARAKQPEAEEKLREAERLKEREPKYEARDRAKAERRKALGEQEKLRAQEARLQGEMDALEQRRRACEEEIERLANAPAALAEKSGKAAVLREERGRLAALEEEKIPALREAWRKHQQAAKAYETAREGYDQALRAHSDAERTLERCRAGILARRLEEGSPCPVCGSTEHPMPAELPADGITEAALKDLAEQLERTREKKDGTGRIAEREKAKCEAQEHALRQEAKELLGSLALQAKWELGGAGFSAEALDGAALKDIVAWVQDASRALEAALSAAAAECGRLRLDGERLEQLQSERKNHQKRQEDKRAVREKLQQAISQTGARLAAAEAELDAMPELPYGNWKEARAAREALEAAARTLASELERAEKGAGEARQKEAAAAAALEAAKEAEADGREKEDAAERAFREKLQEAGFPGEAVFRLHCGTEEEIRALEQAIHAYGAEVQTNAAQLKDARDAAEGKSPVDEEKLQSEMSAQQEHLDRLRRETAETQHRLANLRKAEQQLKEAGRTNEKLRRDWERLSGLHQLVSGQLPGRAKLTLEQYAQQSGFERIVAAANLRLADMTGGQYELYRHEEGGGLQSAMALSLDVLDNFTGRKRPVSTLSGGESFKASLALALGLSDAIASGAGGIAVDTLFIDEGFGTLDDQSLRDAVEMLMTLSANHKLVGVISHREELREAFPRKILVAKTREGSHASIDMGE